MTREGLSDRLADLARDLRTPDDSAVAMDLVCDAAKDWLGAEACVGISLIRRGKEVETPAATSDLVRRGDLLQYELQEGPCLDAAWNEKQVYAGDLAREPRWATWAPRVVDELGVHSMLCTRLFTNEDTLGALNIYSPKADAFDEDSRDDILALASHAAVAVSSARQIEGLAIAVDRRTTIGKAVGMIMERFDLSDDRAFDVLRRLSSHENRKLYDIAEQVVATRRIPG
jgi:GAF domain-containing protein